MNAKDRVLAVLEGRIPDRVPIGEFAVDFDTVEKVIGHETYLRAKAKSQIAFWEGRHDEVADSYLRDHIELHEKLDLDIVTFPMATWSIPRETDDPPPRRIDDATWEDKYGRVWKYSDITADITCIHDPVADARGYTVAEFWGEPTLPVIEDRSWRILDTVIQRFRGEKFVCGPSGGEVGIVMLGGMARGMTMLLDQPEVVRAATKFMVKRQNLMDDVMVHSDSDGVLWGADFGYKSGPFINPEMFREFFFEANRERVRNLREKHGKKVLKHCCGNLKGMLDMFVEIGYDAYQSIQPTAGMDICEIKASHGDRITLWGGVHVEHLLAGTPEEVRQDVRYAMACAKRGGRFILGSSHSIAVGTKYDNYMAMLDEYHKLCDY
jgi:hypothetical protein